MREILFRGKRADNGEWVYGFPFSYQVRLVVEGIETLIGDRHRIDPSTVGQYTGLTGKNGKRIFEGDILLPSKGSLQIHLLVVFLDFSWQMVLPSQKYYRHRLEVKDNGIYEVIGNIHENPELLGEVSDNG